jgi:hypothetical protein
VRISEFNYLANSQEEDEEAGYDVSTVEGSGKISQLLLDMELLEEDWAQRVLSQVFPEFEEAASKLPDVNATLNGESL